MGAQANLLPVRDAIKYGFAYSLIGVEVITGFNGAESLVSGVMWCNLQIGSKLKPKETEFLITPNVTKAIIRLPTLRGFGIAINC